MTPAEPRTRHVLLDFAGEIARRSDGAPLILLSGRDQQLRPTQIEYAPPPGSDLEALRASLGEGRSIEASGHFRAFGPDGEKCFVLVAERLELRG